MEHHGRHLAAGHELARAPRRDRLLPRLAENEKTLIGVCTLLAQSAEKRRVTPAGEWLLDNFYLIEEADPHGAAPPAARLQPRVAAPRERASRRAAARLRHRAATPSPTATAASTRQADALRRRLPDRQAAAARRAVGDPDHAAARADREPAPGRRARGRRAARPRARRRLGRSHDRRRRARPEEPDPCRRRHGAFRAADDGAVRGRAVAPPAGPQHGAGAAAELDRAAPAESGTRRSSSWCSSKASSRPPTRCRSATASAACACSPRWTGASSSRRCPGSTRRCASTRPMSTTHGLRHARPLSPRGRTHRPPQRRGRARSRQRRAASWRTRRPTRPQCELHRTHVGYYLIDAGREDWSARCAMRAPLAHRLRSHRRASPARLVRRRDRLRHAGVDDGSAGDRVERLGAPLTASPLGAWWSALAVLVLLLSASQLAVAIVNWLVPMLMRTACRCRAWTTPSASRAHRARWWSCRRCCRRAAAIDELVEALEVRFLANRDAHLHFALLTDFPDAADRDAAARRGAGRASPRAHRGAQPRYAEPRARRIRRPLLPLPPPAALERAEGVWMGWERKRGKLAELNALLRGGAARPLRADRRRHRRAARRALRHHARHRHAAAARRGAQARRDPGAPAQPPALRRPAGIATRRRRLRHPAAARRRQPAERASRSRFARLFGGDAGIDPYTRAVSDVYQDLFGEGSFIGKGIYDVDAFEHVLGGRFPENRILSHDLLEGGYARAGLVSDVELFEESPSRYARTSTAATAGSAATGRSPPGCCRRVPAGERRRGVRGNPLSPLSRWKILDNLRRSLVPLALLAAAARLGGAGAARGCGRWRRAGDPRRCRRCSALVGDLLRKPVDARAGARTCSARRRRQRSVSCRLAAIALACLPYEAWFSLDAIVRTLWRLLVSRTRPARVAAAPPTRERPAQRRRPRARRAQRMAFAPALAVAAARAAGCARAARGAGRSPRRCCCCGPSSPAIVWWLEPAARTRASRRSTTPQALFLRLLARRTWRFFETFVGAGRQLPAARQLPGASGERSRHRTSPTNIGLSLLANLAAHDFGYLTAAELLERTAATLDDAGRAGALPRPLLQLVRHADARAAAPALRLDRRQRQPRRPPADAARRAARAGRRAARSPTRCSTACATRSACCCESLRSARRRDARAIAPLSRRARRALRATPIAARRAARHRAPRRRR